MTLTGKVHAVYLVEFASFGIEESDAVTFTYSFIERSELPALSYALRPHPFHIEDFLEL